MREELEKAFKFLNREPFQDEVALGKKEYFDKIGAVFEEDAIFEMRLAAFFDWFVFDRRVSGVGLPPIKIYYYANESTMDEEEKRRFEGLLDTVLSVFLLKDETQGGYEVVDLFDCKSYAVPKVSEFSYTGIGNIVEGRLIPAKDGHVFSDPVFSHPADATDRIKKQSRKVSAGRDKFRDFVFGLAAMSVKLHRYKHLKVLDIYRFDGK